MNESFDGYKTAYELYEEYKQKMEQIRQIQKCCGDQNAKTK